MTIPGTATANIQPGKYKLQVDALVGSDYRAAYYGEVNVYPAIGTGTVLPTYCTLQDMQDFYPSILSFFNNTVHVFGYMRQRNRVWADINRAFIQRYSPQPGFNLRWNGVYAPVVGYNIPDLVTTPPTTGKIRSALAMGGLVLFSPDDMFISGIAAMLSTAEVLCPQDGGDRRSNAYVQIADDIRTVAMARLSTYPAYVDTNNDGFPDVIITRDVIFLGPPYVVYTGQSPN